MGDKDSSNFKWITVGVSLSILALSATIQYSFSVFFVALLKEFGWSRSMTAGAYSLFMILHGLISPFAGSLVDRFGPRRVFLSGSLFLGTAFALCSLTRSWWQLYLFFSVLTSMGVTATGWVPNMTVIQNSFQEKRGLAMGIVSCGTGVAILVGVPSVQHLINWVGWRKAYLVMAVFIPVSIIFMVMIFMRNRPRIAPSGHMKERVIPTVSRDPAMVDTDWISRTWTLRHVISTRQFWLVGTCMFFNSIVSQSILTHQVAFWVDGGLDILFASYIVGMIGVVSIGGKMLWGTLSDKIGREVTYTLVIACGVCGMLSLIVFTFLASPSIPFLYVLFFGLGYAGTAVLPPLVTADFFAGRTYGKIFGVIFVFTGIGGALGAWLAGFVYDHMRSYVPFLFFAIACAIIACLAVWIAAPRKVRAVPGKRME